VPRNREGGKEEEDGKQVKLGSRRPNKSIRRMLPHKPQRLYSSLLCIWAQSSLTSVPFQRN
jgi:hypothetical protein